MKRLITIVIAGAALIALLRPQQASTQSEDLEMRLAAAKRIECKFTALATGDWKNDSAQASVSTVEESVAFHAIDVDEGTAEADGEFGESFIVVRYSHGYLHLMQMSGSGPLRVTTVFAQPASKGRMKAMQTRAEYTSVSLPGFTSRPEMYVGDCAVAD